MAKANRPIFIANSQAGQMVLREDVEFTWYPGFADSQKQESIKSLHEKAMKKCKVGQILEISSKSLEPLGQKLSAFQLSIPGGYAGRSLSVECAYQGSKVFENGGPYIELYSLTSREAKRDERLKESGQLIEFRFREVRWPLNPQNAFYDWLYIHVLLQNPELAEALEEYSVFSDIEFNPDRQKSPPPINCQAHSAALYVALKRRNLLDEAMKSQEAFISIAYQDEPKDDYSKLPLF